MGVHRNIYLGKGKYFLPMVKKKAIYALKLFWKENTWAKEIRYLEIFIIQLIWTILIYTHIHHITN